MDDYKCAIIKLIHNINDNDKKFLKKIYTLIYNHIRQRRR